MDNFADAVAIRQHDHTPTKMIEKRVRDLSVVRLLGSQVERDREDLRVDDVDLGPESAA